MTLRDPNYSAAAKSGWWVFCALLAYWQRPWRAR
jgi:hypothetical protein